MIVRIKATHNGHAVLQRHNQVHLSLEVVAKEQAPGRGRSRHGGRGRQRHVRLSVSSVRLARGTEVLGDLFRSVGEVEVVQRAVEHLQGGLGLVEGDFVAGLVDAEEADCLNALVDGPFF